jgi:hypothetical protein
VKVFTALGIADVRRQLVSYGGGDHMMPSPGCPLAMVRQFQR